MKQTTRTTMALLTGLGSLICWPVYHAEEHPIDVAQSAMRVHVYKTGFFAAFGHDHEIEAPIAEGKVENLAYPAVELRVEAGKLRVLDPELSQENRTQVQKTMQGPEVLDSQRFPEILFRSTAVEKKGDNFWSVRGDLTLHGQTRPVSVDVTLKDGRYQGSTTLRQRDFGITPVSVAGGTVRVKNEVRIEFDILPLK